MNTPWRNRLRGTALIGLGLALNGCGDAGSSDVAVSKPSGETKPAAEPKETPVAQPKNDQGKVETGLDVPGHVPTVGVKPVAHSQRATAPAFDALPLASPVESVATRDEHGVLPRR